MFFFHFSAVKTEHDDSVEFVSSYVRDTPNDCIIYEGTQSVSGTVKKETSLSDYMADDSSADYSTEIGNVDYSNQLYELYNSRRNSIAIGVASVLQADDQQIGHDAERHGDRHD